MSLTTDFIHLFSETVNYKKKTGAN
jgi:hypothetical protein